MNFSLSAINVRRVKLWLGLALAPVVLLATGCQTTGGGSEANASALRVGVSPNAAPIVYKTAGGGVDGVEARFAKKLAAQLGTRVKFVKMPFEKLLPAVQAGKVDIVMSGVTVTAERESLVSFSDPYMISGQAIMVRSHEMNTFVQPQIIFMMALPIGVERGSIAETLARRACQAATVVPFDSIESASAALRKGTVRCVLGDAPVLWRTSSKYQAQGLVTIPHLLTRERLAWAVRKGDVEMLNGANNALRSWRSDGSLHQILSEFMPRYEMLMKL